MGKFKSGNLKSSGPLITAKDNMLNQEMEMNICKWTLD